MAVMLVVMVMNGGGVGERPGLNLGQQIHDVSHHGFRQLAERSVVGMWWDCGGGGNKQDRTGR
jgi:hypothetical protein